tara:strand:- start:471 stop:998 length:528 start_codon:yes stop_codon:yes gene_type:complete
MKKFLVLLIIPFFTLDAQDLLKDLKLPVGKKVKKLEKKIANKQNVIDSLKAVNADLLEKNKMLSEKTNATDKKSEQLNSSIIDKVVVFENLEVSDDMYVFFSIPEEDEDLEFRGGTISPQLLDSELMGDFEMGKHINQKFRVLYENRDNKIWEGGIDWGEWIIEKGPFLIGIEKL